MTTLRVLVDATPARGLEQPWALFDDAGACVRTGRGPPDAWPAAARVEAVLAASQVRIASIALPPLAPARVAAAAAFAVDDQLAGPPEAHHLAVSTQQTGGRVRVVIAARPMIAVLRDRHATGGPFARVIAESDLASPYAGWRWCASAGSSEGFVRRSDGSAFPVSAKAATDALPAELVLALTQRGGKAPAEVRVEREATDADLLRWQKETGVAFVRGAPWRWSSVPAAAFAGAVDLLQADLALTGPPPAGGRARLFVPALALAAAALAVHVVATFGEWSAQKFEGWGQAREWSALAASAGVAPDSASTPAAAQTAIAKRYSQLRHAHGLPAPDDALPLLARASASLRALPAGSMKSASYADGHWTLDIARADPATIAELDTRLRQAGLPAVVATSPAGTRIRVGAW